jgi:hypothetical protein
LISLRDSAALQPSNPPLSERFKKSVPGSGLSRFFSFFRLPIHFWTGFAHQIFRIHRSTDTFDGTVFHAYTMSTSANPRDVEEQISRIIRLKIATAKDKQRVIALKAEMADLDKKIADIKFDEKGLEAYKALRALLDRLAETEVN